jgi:hypothetical protein
MSIGRRLISLPGVLSCAAVVVASVGVRLALAPTPNSTAVLTHQPVPAAASLPAPPEGLAIPKPRALDDPSGETRWAPVIQPALARGAPSLASPVVARVGTRTPEGTANLVVSTGEITRRGVTWIRASLAVLPNGTDGWLPRSSLGGWSFVDTSLVINRRRLRLTLLRAGQAVFSAPVGIGAAGTPTPVGRFYVRDRLTSFASPAYGPIAFGTSARAPYLTDWPDGGYIGIHGTNEPQLIPGQISHGCIRLTNAAILRLAQLMPVGTPVTIT